MIRSPKYISSIVPQSIRLLTARNLSSSVTRMSYPSKEEISNAVQESHSSTKQFVLTETAIRISKPLETIKFYTGVLGMTLLLTRDDEKTRSSYYVFTFVNKNLIPQNDEKAFHKWRLGRSGNLEMAYSWDSIEHPTKYQCGKLNPDSFGHFGICVPDYEAAMKRFRELGCQVVENPADTSLSYILDPDGYKVEIFECHWS
ncbi:lactoylglutathione lyase-like [Clytia hemisphaerica]|uniref:VOC domain-containing protein n=1 Tax=Clytia hemisphaerica TaxID=252671 RepID=A0A7M6DNM0_9CNID